MAKNVLKVNISQLKIKQHEKNFKFFLFILDRFG
jgi:hypothetical protein